ncbi:dihydrodipicolinate synthase family protein [Salipiger sp. 1_MG-2023]|uniref:dihydrodipicolinate synthase family protein n=1 Tax=Salipiger sp. 1_MG-2023 TaxID=3062665 RepID=UPI0026E385D2|nr:dihydrodipicolinate synthase family protein [Salipiger sp. 1_MG-2023]MDO6587247.1 dihydrodipicolinate synthase family protein [Salipiger sp. 1_MG-2023]
MSKALAETCGLHVVAQTPFLEDGALDLASIDTLSAFYYRHGAQGLTVLGVSGEAQKLTVDETIAVAAHYVAAADGHRIIAGVSHPNLATLVEVTREVIAEGADAVMICPPAGIRTDEDLLRYFDAVFERIGDVPTVLQDFPAASGVVMSVPAIDRLITAFPQIGVIKEEDFPSLPKITRMRNELSRPVRILTGNNGQFLVQEMERGADGPMAGFSYPEMLSGVYGLMTAGKRAEAHDLFNRYLPLLKHEAQGQWGIALRKEMMRRRGALRSNALRGPGPRLTEADLAELDFLVGRMDLPQG